MYDVIIIGGGASGCACAINLKKNNKNINVIILEQNDKILKKLLKTGNGKCNISNKYIEDSKYNDFSLIGSNIEKVNIEDFFLNEGLVIKEQDAGRMYPYSETSTSVVNIILNSLNKYDIPVKVNYKVYDVKKENDLFIINNSLKAKYIVFASGSISQEKTNGYELIKSFGHKVSELSPGLVNLITKESTQSLRGLRIKCKTVINNKDYYGELLFKENGLSGIIAFDLSRVIRENDVVSFDIAPDFSIDKLTKLLNSGDLDVILTGLFPKMLCFDLIKRSGKNIKELVKVIKNYTFKIVKKGSFDNSQITVGGVQTKEVSQCFESKIVKGLYIVGELLDVDGASGGYNLYFAWLSGIVSSINILKNFK